VRRGAAVLAITCMAAGWASPSALARRPARARPGRPDARPSDSGAREAKVLILRRDGVAAYRETAQAFRRLTPHRVTEVACRLGQSEASLREEIAEEKPDLVVALGRLASVVLKPGLGSTPLVFAYLAEPPATAAPIGGFVTAGPSARVAVEWMRRLRPLLVRAGVIVRAGRDPLEAEFRAACTALGVRPLVAQIASESEVPSALVKLAREGAESIWGGHDVALFPLSSVRAAARVQALFRIPVLGITREHARAGLALAIDSPPEEVAAGLKRLLDAHAGGWISRARAAARRPPSAGGAASGSGPAAVPEAVQLVQTAAASSRVSYNPESARALGLQVRSLESAGARPVSAGGAP
jgi:hypothetical protein